MERSTIILFIGIICTGAILLIVLPGTDKLENCQKDDPNLPYNQPVGQYFLKPFQRLYEVLNNINGFKVFPSSQVIHHALQNHSSSIRHKTKYTNLLWAWLQFIGHDLADYRVNETLPFETILSTVYLRDSHTQRQQLNYATPRLDGSQLYGLDQQTAAALRRLDGTGQLKSSLSTFLDAGDDEMMLYNETSETFLYADQRSQQGEPLVNALYHLWLREHNYWCVRLKLENPSYAEEDIHQLAKHLVIGEMQAITYKEALPALLGDELYPYCFQGIEKTPTVINEWAFTALPALYSMVPSFIVSRDQYNNQVIRNESAYQAPPSQMWEQGISALLLGGAQQRAEPLDALLSPIYQDLVNQTVDRARNHQLPSYQALYKLVFDHKIHHCHEFALEEDCALLDEIYHSGIDDLDLWVGLLVEKNQRLLKYLFTKQFEELKNRDPYFYTSNFAIHTYRAEIHHTKLSTIILRNTNIHRGFIRPNVFVV